MTDMDDKLVANDEHPVNPRWKSVDQLIPEGGFPEGVDGIQSITIIQKEQIEKVLSSLPDGVASIIHEKSVMVKIQILPTDIWGLGEEAVRPYGKSIEEVSRLITKEDEELLARFLVEVGYAEDSLNWVEGAPVGVRYFVLKSNFSEKVLHHFG